MSSPKLSAWFVAGALLCSAGAPSLAAPPAARATGGKRAVSDLKSPSFEARVAAIEALVAQREPGAVDAILPLLRDSDPTVRWTACDGLDKLGDARALPALQAASTDEAPWVSERARDAVRSLSRDTTRRPVGVVLVKTVATDLSGGSVPGIAPELEKAAAFMISGPGLRVATGVEEPSYQLTVTVQSIKETASDRETQVEVTGTATVTEQPGNLLRFTTRVGAGLAIGAKLPPAKRNEMILDGVRAVGQRLGEEAMQWLRSPR